MKAYEKQECSYDYPEEMEQILSYLMLHGTLHIDGPAIESLYRKYSEEAWSAGWMAVNHVIIREFADWLADYDL